MANILFITTLVLNFTGFIFAGVLLWINLFGDYDGLIERNANAAKIVRASMITSILFAFLTCLLDDSSNITAAITKSALLYSIIAITWLAVMLICGIVMLFILISKKHYKPEVSHATKRLFKIALPASIICLILTWLFS